MTWRVPVFTAPRFSWSAIISLALPLFVVTMASQNLPGVAAIQAAGYGGAKGMPISKIITLTGLVTLVLAPFGAFALNLSRHHRRHLHGPRSARGSRQTLHGRGVVRRHLHA